jgi:hypothetical protein
MKTVLDESLALLQLREKLVRYRERNEPRELIEIVESQIRQQAKLDAERLHKINEKDANANSPRGSANAEIKIEIKTLIKLNTQALKMIQDFGILDDHDLTSLMETLRRCYIAMTLSCEDRH